MLAEDGRHRRPDLAGGALLDLGIYPLSIARYLLGEPTDVRALGTLTEQGVDAVVAGSLKHESGATSVFTATIDAVTDHGARIAGTEGTITVEPRFWHSEAYVITPADGSPPERVEIPNRGLGHEAEHVIEQVRAGRIESDVMTWAATMANMELMDEIRRQIGVVYPEER